MAEAHVPFVVDIAKIQSAAPVSFLSVSYVSAYAREVLLAFLCFDREPSWACAAIRCLVTAMAASAVLLPWTFAMIAAFRPAISSTLFVARYSAEALRLRVCPLIS